MYNKLKKILIDRYKLNYIFNINKVTMNTEEIIQDSLFFAINNGNHYIEKAIQKGASIIICDKKNEELIKKYKNKIIVVNNTVKEMQELAKIYRKKLENIIIAITGSNGKTSTKDILYNILSVKYKTKKTISNYNNEIGLPFTLLNMEDNTEICILEMGMSSFGEINLLSSISLPNYGIITNIGESHLENLKTKENIFKAKTELLNYLDINNLFVCGDDIYLSKLNCVKIGYNKNNNHIISECEINEDGMSFYLDSKSYSTNIVGKHQSINISLAIKIAYKLGLNYSEISNALKELELTKMRFEISKINEDIIINDAYNASPTSMTASLETFKDIYLNGYRVCILGDMLELGEDSIMFHKKIIKILLDLKIDKIYLVGSIFNEAYKELGIKDLKFKTNFSIEEIIEDLNKILAKKVILVKSSHGMELYKICEKLLNLNNNNIGDK